MKTTSALSRRARRAALLSLCVCAGAAYADPGDFGDVCNLFIPGMTDLDQVRSTAPGIDGLPNNGTQYCVPTCQIDLLKYLANNGYPQLDPPGPGPWTTPAVYNDHTFYLELMGAAMGTSATGGTGGTGANNGIQGWLNSFDTDGDITFTSKFRSSTDAPELGDFALAILVGQITSGSVGWYSQGAGNVWTRNGGHCFPLTGLPGFCTANRSVTIRDPGDGGADSTTQSSPLTVTYPIFTRNATFQSLDNMGNVSSSYTGPLDQMVGYGGGGNSGHLDGFRAYAAKYGITYDGFGLNMVIPHGGFTLGPRATHINIPGGGSSVVDMAMHPNLVYVDVLFRNSAGQAQLVRTAPNVGRSEPITLPTGIGPVQRVVHGQNWRNIYVMSGNLMMCMIVRADGSAALDHSLLLPAAPSSIAYDQKNRRFVALAPSLGAVLEIAEDMSGYERRELPKGVVLGEGSQATICPKGAYLWIVTPGEPGAQGLLPRREGGFDVMAKLDHPSIDDPTDVDSDDRGHVFVVADGSVHEFVPPKEEGEAWLPAVQKYFGDNYRSVKHFAVLRSRNNIDPLIHDTKSWNDVLPTEFVAGKPECVADFNQDGIIDVADLFEYINAWLAKSNKANFNGMNGVDVADLFAYINQWLARCD